MFAENSDLGLQAGDADLSTVEKCENDISLDLGLFRLGLGHQVNNPSPRAVASRSGFAAEGIERQKLRYGSVRLRAPVSVAFRR
jgi:RimJ/RimL family protein N-acetyltransferase